jgi:hypothetical protein
MTRGGAPAAAPLTVGAQRPLQGPQGWNNTEHRELPGPLESTEAHRGPNRLSRQERLRVS